MRRHGSSLDLVDSARGAAGPHAELLSRLADEIVRLLGVIDTYSESAAAACREIADIRSKLDPATKD